MKKLNYFIEGLTKISFEETIDYNNKLLSKSIRGAKCLIIGGAGTIGSNYIKLLLEFKPSKLTIVDHNENGLTELTRDLRSSKLLDYNPEYITYPVSLLSPVFDKIFFDDHYDLVSNFSAHKHVRSEKDIISVESLIRNNIYGAIKLLKLCEIKKPSFFFSVSTDKATNPVNIMGASKSIMEKLILSKKNIFRVSTARFANVAFSNGSLLSGFLDRINKNQPLSCPSDIRRFFVTPKQSGQICLLSTFLEKSGTIFFPKLNFETDQIYFKEIALNFLKYQGYEPKIFDIETKAKQFNIDNKHNEYPIFLFKSDTSGEKEYEEFYSSNDNINLNKIDSLGFIISKKINIDENKLLSDFENLFSTQPTKKDVVELIKYYVDDFSHIEKNKNLDQKM